MKGKRATIPDGPEQEQRDKNLKHFNAWVKAKPWGRAHVDELLEIDAPEFESPDWMSGHEAMNLVSWIQGTSSYSALIWANELQANRELDRLFGARH